MKIQSHASDAQQNAAEEFARKKQFDDRFFSQLKETATLEVIIAHVREKNQESREVQYQIENEIKRQHEKERDKFASEIAEYQAANAAFQSDAQKKDYEALQQKLSQLKNIFTQLNAYLLEAISAVEKQIAQSKAVYDKLAVDLVERTRNFISALPMQKFKRNNGADIYDLQEHILKHLQSVFDEFQNNQISPEDYSKKVTDVLKDCVSSFIEKMDIQDDKQRKAVSEQVKNVADGVASKMEAEFFPAQAESLKEMRDISNNITQLDERLESLKTEQKKIEGILNKEPSEMLKERMDGADDIDKMLAGFDASPLTERQKVAQEVVSPPAIEPPPTRRMP